eukprot:GSChrysophyteH1.ASY1.ANO1.2747.1 assembled CDS
MFKSLMATMKGTPVVATVELKGAIQDSVSKGICLKRHDASIVAAFSTSPKCLQAVVLKINSPGGSPVQSSLLYKRIKQLKEQTNKKRKAMSPSQPPIPVLAVVEDLCASGGYYIAMSCDEILVDPCSIVGSIGVIGGGFGFVDLANKMGVERRVFTSGSSKSQMDPFLPIKESDLKFTQHSMDQIHNEFISVVQDSRRDKLNIQAAKDMAVSLGRDGDGLFDGSYYTGKDAISMGMADAIGDLHSEVAKRYGDDCLIINHAPRGGLDKFMGMSMSALIRAFISELDRERLYARFAGFGKQ